MPEAEGTARAKGLCPRMRLYPLSSGNSQEAGMAAAER